MSTAVLLSGRQLERLQELSTAAIGNVTRGLTEMFSADVIVTAMHIRVVPLGEVAGLIGDPEMEIAGVYLEAAGEIPGQMLLLMHLPTAFQFCDILLELPPGATQELGELEISALGEVGNIVGSFFLNSLADNVGLTLHITPPGIVCDMAGAAIDLALVGVAMYADEAIVIDANFEAQGRRLPAWFLVFPEPEHLQHILGLEAA